MLVSSHASRRNDGDALQRGSTATPFSRFLWAVVAGDLATAEAQLADDVEWGLMPYSKTLRGKQEIIPWLKAGAASRKDPIAVNNVATRDWGVFELWNIGIVTEELVAFGKRQDWPFPGEPESLVGRQYKVAECFVYHINAEGRIDLMRQYLDAGSVWAQFK